MINVWESFWLAYKIGSFLKQLCCWVGAPKWSRRVWFFLCFAPVLLGSLGKHFEWLFLPLEFNNVCTFVIFQVPLKPGRSLMDWIRLTKSGKDLTGLKGRLIEVTEDELAKHNKKEDCWICIRGWLLPCCFFIFCLASVLYLKCNKATNYHHQKSSPQNSVVCRLCVDQV